MESYRVGGLPNHGLQQNYARARNQNNGYGLSIRVQGIDGHPYVVLNNQDRQANPYPASNNGFTDPEGSFIENYQEYDFRGTRENLSDNPFVEYRAQHSVQHVGPYNGVSDPRETQMKPLSQLNYHKHPEILKPYDPELNTLDRFPSIPHQHLSSTDARNALPRTTSPATNSSYQDQPKATDPAAQKLSQSQVLPQPYQARAQPQKVPSRSQTQSQPGPKPQPRGQSLIKSQSQPQVQPASSQPSQHPPCSQAPATSFSSEQSSYRNQSSASSANSSLEWSRREPDVLPLRRTDSSGPVLQSSRSRNPSVSSMTKEEQLDALYGDSVNRHENRRYIPFMPGTGRDIDTGSIPGVDELIVKFDGKETQQRRGRTGRRNRINPEDRKRSRSVDSALPFGLHGDAEYIDEVSRNRGRSTERLLKPSQVVQKSPSSFSSIGRRGNSPWINSEPTSPQESAPSVTNSLFISRKPLSRPSILPAGNAGNVAERRTPATRTVTSVATTSLSKGLTNDSKKTNTEV